MSRYQASWRARDGRKLRTTVPEGFVTNMASSPRILWWLVGPWDLGPAVVIHDWLYHSGGSCEKASDNDQEWVPVHIDRREADYALRTLMRRQYHLVVWWRRNSAWWAVRRFGRPYWHAAETGRTT